MSYVVDFEDDNEATSDLFDCEFSSVDAVINEVAVFTGFQERSTENGTKTLIAFGEGYSKSAFFTDSKKLRDVVADPSRKFPFRAVIKVVKYGNMYGFRFFSPSTQITKEDQDNLEAYKRNKWRKR